MKLFGFCHALVLRQRIVAFILLGWRFALLVHHCVVYKSLLVHIDVDVNIDVQVEMIKSVACSVLATLRLLTGIDFRSFSNLLVSFLILQLMLLTLLLQHFSLLLCHLNLMESDGGVLIVLRVKMLLVAQVIKDLL